MRTEYLCAPHSFTEGIEGPACDRLGNVYAVNFARQGTMGVVTPAGNAYVFVELPQGSVGNGTRFDSEGNMLVADKGAHRILKVDMRTRAVGVLADGPFMHEPNDLCITEDDRVFASDPEWTGRTGRIWKVTREGGVSLASQPMGTTNGIEISVDGKRLYVDESEQRRIWRYDLEEGTLANKTLFHEFPDFGLDGMRFDVEGNLYVTRYGKGTVAVLDPLGRVVEEMDLRGTRPSNLCFGGEDGRTLYVTEVDHGSIEWTRVPHPGREWALWQRRKPGSWDR